MLEISASNVRLIIVELAERSPIIIQSSSNPSSQKKFGCTYNRMTAQGATFNMHGQLYHRHANAMALFSSPVVSALGFELDDPGSSPGQGKALCPWDVQEKKMRAPLLGLAKSIYYMSLTGIFWSPYLWAALHFIQLYCFIYTSASCLVLTL